MLSARRVPRVGGDFQSLQCTEQASLRKTKPGFFLYNEKSPSLVNSGFILIGFSSDGEFNSLRTMGSKRPISVIQLMMNARAKARSMSVKAIEKCVRPIKGLLYNI